MLNQFLFDRHLEEDEELVLMVHKHWMLGMKHLFWPTFTILGAWILAYASSWQPNLLYFAALLTLVLSIWWLRNFFDYYLDVWLITNQGIIDIEWHGWFHRESSRVLYSDIQGVSYEIQGVLPTLMRYGTISVEKISTGDAISMESVPRPRKVETVVLKNMETYLHSKNLKDSKQVQELLANVIARELQMKGFAPHEEE